MRKIRLGVNIDHVATIRNARGEDYPDPLRAALIAQKYGADSITVHLREDRRHIKDQDLKKIIKSIKKEKNILVEKPATLNLSQMQDVQNKLLNKNLLFTEAFMYRYHPQIIKVIKLIRGNVIG